LGGSSSDVETQSGLLMEPAAQKLTSSRIQKREQRVTKRTHILGLSKQNSEIDAAQVS
jgi:hypothetical protein